MSNPSPSAAVATSPSDLIAKLGNPDDSVRGPAWQQAWSMGPSVVGPLIAAMGGNDHETVRAAKRALWNVVDHSGRPGASSDRHAVVKALIAGLNGGGLPVVVSRELLWMLSTIGENDAVGVVASRLADPELREDARCVLQRFPGRSATEALRDALKKATDDFAVALADALRARGESVKDQPSRRLVPVKATGVGRSVG